VPAPDPIVQVGRTTNTFEAVSGRIGALAIRNDGTIVLGAAQGGIWTYDTASQTWTSRTSDTTTQSVGALAIAPSDDKIIYAGSGEGALSGDSYYGDGVYKSTDGGVSWARVSGDQFNGQASSAIVVDPANPDHVYLATLRGRGGARRTTHPTDAQFGGVDRGTVAGTGPCARAPRTNCTVATDPGDGSQTRGMLWASFWGDAIYRSTDGRRDLDERAGQSARGQLP